MNARILVLTTLAVGMAVPAAAQTLTGTWELEVRRSGRMQVQLRMDDERRNNWGFGIDGDELEGLNRSALGGSRADVTFRLVRDGGTTRFEGRMNDRRGVGDFEFEINPDFVSGMATLGYPRLSNREIFTMAMVDVSRDFVRELRGLGYDDVDRDDLISMGIHGARPEFIRDMAAAGYSSLGVQQLLQFRIHGVSEAFVREMRISGHVLDASELVQARIHGVSPEYVSALARSDLDGLTFDNLLQFRIHGVSSDLVRETAARYGDVSASDLVQMRIHGVSSGFVAGMDEIGYDNLSIDDLVQMRIHGVSPGFARDIADAGFDQVSGRELIQMRIHGVNAGFARNVKRRDPNATAGDVIDDRIHGRRR